MSRYLQLMRLAITMIKFPEITFTPFTIILTVVFQFQNHHSKFNELSTTTGWAKKNCAKFVLQ